MMYCTTTNLKNNLARGNVKFTTGKLDVMNNHLLNCDYVPPQVQDCASKHRKSDSNETSDDDAGSTVTSKRSHSLIESGDPSQDRTGARLTKKQKSFTVIATKHAPFNTKKQTLFEDQLLRAPAQVIDGFKIGTKKRNRQIETLENEKAEQANEIEQLKAQLNLLARAQIDREKLEQLLKERTEELSSAQAFLGKADSISVTEVSKMVEMLNAEVLQVSALVADSLSQRRMAKDDQADQALVNDAMHAVKSFIGPRLQSMLMADIIDPEAKFDPTLSQIILQSGLINACALIMRGWNPPDWESFSNLEKLYSAIRSSGEHIRNAVSTFLTLFLRGTSHCGSMESTGAYLYSRTGRERHESKEHSVLEADIAQFADRHRLVCAWSARSYTISIRGKDRKCYQESPGNPESHRKGDNVFRFADACYPIRTVVQLRVHERCLRRRGKCPCALYHRAGPPV